MTAVLALLQGTFGKYIIYGVLALALVGGYFGWKWKVKNEARAVFQAEQLKQALKDNEKFRLQMEEIDRNRQAIIDDLNKKNDELEAQNRSITDWIDSEGKKSDRPSSEVLKETIRRFSK
jgi:uncharacterized protein HemX